MTWVSAAVVILAGGVAAGAEAPERVLERVLAAYRDTKAYAATTRHSFVIDRGRREQTEWQTFEVAYDAEAAEGPRLKVDRPQVDLVVRDGSLWLAIEGMERYVKTAAPTPLNYAAVSNVLPTVERPVLPDVALLLGGDDPLSPLAGWWQAEDLEASEATANGDGKPRLSFRTQSGRMTFTLDPTSMLITRAEQVLDPAAVGLPPGASVTEVYEIDVRAHNAALPEGAFAFDAGQREAVDTVRGLFGEEAAAEEPASPLVGQPAAGFAFTTPDGASRSLADVKADVVVLDFWATWCLPCRMWMPQLAEIQRWADAEGLSVAVVGVTVDDPADFEKAKEYWRKQAFPFTLAIPSDPAAVEAAYAPEVRDPSGRVVGKSFSLPYTVVVNRGVVADVHAGVGPQMRDELTAQIRELLGKR